MLRLDDLPRSTLRLPPARGRLSRALLATLRQGADLPALASWATDDPLVGDDFHLALYLCYELSYRGLPGVDPGYETDLRVVRFRQTLERRFESALRVESTTFTGAFEAGTVIEGLLSTETGPSLSSRLHRGTRDQFLEFLIHRSAYQLKEADPHSWAIPRLAAGARKTALLEIQLDEYGRAKPGQSHAELFADAMRAAGLDPRYGAYLHLLPGPTLATCNLISLFGSRRELTAALLGHLAVFEMTSVEPMGRYAQTARRLGLGDVVARFYDVHVDADEHHGAVARDVLIGGDLRADGFDPAEVVFGAEALLNVERRFSQRLISSWHSRASALRLGTELEFHPEN